IVRVPPPRLIIPPPAFVPMLFPKLLLIIVRTPPGPFSIAPLPVAVLFVKLLLVIVTVPPEPNCTPLELLIAPPKLQLNSQNTNACVEEGPIPGKFVAPVPRKKPPPLPIVTRPEPENVSVPDGCAKIIKAWDPTD